MHMHTGRWQLAKVAWLSRVVEDDLLVKITEFVVHVVRLVEPTEKGHRLLQDVDHTVHLF